TLRRVGACSKIGSLVSGGIHIRQREPCCWKCTSSVAHRSTAGSVISAWSFFYALAVVRDRLAPPAVGVCVSGIPTAETVADTGALAAPFRTGAQSRRTRSCRPTNCRPGPPRAAIFVKLHPPLPIASRLVGVVAPSVRPPAGPSGPPPRNASPSIRRSAERLPTGRRPADSSSPGPPGALHAGGDHSAIPRCAESHPVSREPRLHSPQCAALSCFQENTIF